MPDPDSCAGSAPSSAYCYYPACSCGWKASRHDYVYSEESFKKDWQRHVDAVSQLEGIVVAGQELIHPTCEKKTCNKIAYAKVTCITQNGTTLEYQFCKMHCPEFEIEQPIVTPVTPKKKRATNPLPQPTN